MIRTETLRPSGLGTIDVRNPNNLNHTTNWATANSQIDEESPNDADYFGIFSDSSVLSIFGRRSFTLPNVSLVGIIESVAVVFRVQGHHPSGHDVDHYWAKPILYTHGAEYTGNEYHTAQDVWATCTQTWTANPNTNQPWTWDEINALEAGVSLWTLGVSTAAYSHMFCSWLCVVITHITPAGNRAQLICLMF